MYLFLYSSIFLLIYLHNISNSTPVCLTLFCLAASVLTLLCLSADITLPHIPLPRCLSSDIPLPHYLCTYIPFA